MRPLAPRSAGLGLSLAGVAVATAAAIGRFVLPREAIPALEAIGLGALAFAAGALGRSGGAARRALARAETEIAALRRLAARNAEIVEGAGEAIIVIDDRATILTFNRAAERMFGYPAAEMIGASLERLMTENGRKAHAAYLAQNGVTAMVEAARLRTVHKGVRKRGDVFAFELAMTEWSDGEQRVFTGVMRDVTERERAADAVREADGRYAELFEAFVDPLFVFSLGGDGGFVLDRMNRAAEEATGMTRFAVAGWAPEQLASADEGRALKRSLLECLSLATVVETVATLPAAEGSQTVRLTLSPMRHGSGEIRRILVRAGTAAVAAGKTRVA